MSEHIDDLNDTPPSDDELAGRIRGAVDGRVTPVTLDEVLGRVGPTAAATTVGPEPAVDGEAPVVEHEVTPLAARRRLAPMVLSAAAAIVVLLGVTVLVTRDRDDQVDVGIPPASTEPENGGGIFDPTGGVLADRQVSAIAAGSNGLVYLAYDSPDATAPPVTAPRGTVPAEPERGDPGYGLLVADAASGEVLADHQIPGWVEPGDLLTVGDRVWFLAHTEPQTERSGPSVRLLGAQGIEAPTQAEAFDAPVSVAVDGDDLWIRQTDELSHTSLAPDAIGGESSNRWSGAGTIATGDGGTWSTNGDDAVAQVDTEGAPAFSPIRSVTVTQHDDPEGRRLLVDGGAVLVVDQSRAVRIDGQGAVVPTVYPSDSGAGITGSSAAAGRFWLVNQNTDPGTALIDVTVIDAATGESRTSSISLVGSAPVVAASADGAVVCAVTLRASEPDDAGSASSTCQRVSLPFEPGLPADQAMPDDSVATTSAIVPPAENPPASQVTSTTTTTTAPAALTANRITFDGITLAGGEPIRLGMTADELTAATGLATVPVEEVCASHGRDVVGLPEGIFVVFDGNDTVRAVTIRSAAFSTVEGGITVDSTVAELVRAYPTVEVFDLITANLYAVIAPDRSRGIFVTGEGDDITHMIVTFGDEPFLDLC